jgi:hypothetical protein
VDREHANLELLTMEVLLREGQGAGDDIRVYLYKYAPLTVLFAADYS